MIKKIFFLSYFFLISQKKGYALIRQLKITRRIRASLNDVVFEFVGKNCKSSGDNQDLIVLDFINKLISDHCMHRERLFRVSCEIQKIFIFLSYLNFLLFSIKYVAVNIVDGIFPYDFRKINFFKNHILCCNFNSHHYSLSQDKDGLNIRGSSIGDFLKGSYGEYDVYTLNENVRVSQEFEFNGKILSREAPSIKRTKLNIISKISAQLFSNLYKICNLVANEFFILLNRKSSLIASIANLALLASSLKFNSIEKKSKGKRLFFYKAYDWDIKYKLSLAGVAQNEIFCISYSSNILEAEDYKFLFENQKKFQGIPRYKFIGLNVFLTDPNSLGYHYHDSILNFARKEVDNKYGTNLARLNRHNPDSTPIQLGFESVSLPANKWDIIIFDSPPLSKLNEIAVSLYGCPCSTFMYYKKFINQILITAQKFNLTCALKVKYSISNYDNEFQGFIVGLKERGVVIVDSYSNNVELILHSKLCISFPVTGTYELAKTCNIPSIIFFPKLSDFECDAHLNKDFIVGEISLGNLLKESFNISAII